MKSVVEILSDLIRIPSPSAISNRPVVEYASQALRGAGWSVRDFPYFDAAGVEKVNLIAAPPGQSPEEPRADLAVVCHTDTVPYAADWPQALEPFVSDGVLHGCGACDVKGFLAVILAAIDGENRSHFPNGLRIVLTAEEEIGCVGSARLLKEDVLRPRRMIIGEPTSLHPARAGKGYCLAEVTVFGKEAHSAHPQQGVSAIYQAARLISAIEELAAEFAHETHPFFEPGFTSLNVGTIQGGTAKNIVPGSCRFQLEWRPIPGQAADRVLARVVGIAEEMKRERADFRAEIRPVRQQSGFETSANAPLVRSLETLTGRSAVSIPFGSEASVFGPLTEEIVVIGPGDMRTAHSSRECVAVAELEEAVRFLGFLMRQ